LKTYLAAATNQLFSVLSLLTPIAVRQDDFDDFAAVAICGMLLTQYEIQHINMFEAGSFAANVSEEYVSASGIPEKSQTRYKIILEKDVYKVERAK